MLMNSRRYYKAKVTAREIILRFKPSLKNEALYDYVLNHLRSKFPDENILSWAIIKATKEVLTISIVFTDIGTLCSYNFSNFMQPRDSNSFSAVQLIPTGIGASVGGFAGDAGPCTKLFGTIADFVVTHPNTINASDFYGGTENTLYVEGYTLDQFMIGNVALLPVKSNRIGLIIDKTDKRYVDNILCATDAVRAVHGVDVIGYVITDKPIGGTVQKTSMGSYAGSIENPNVLLKTVEKLIIKGANAIAIASEIKGVSEDELINNYKGKAPHPIGGVEAVISRLISSYFLLPSAHAPIVNSKILDKNAHNFEYDPRSAGELISKTGLPCILMGLSKAPQIIRIDALKDEESPPSNVLTVNNIGAVVAPASAMGGIPMLVCEKKGIPIVSVAENKTILDVTGEKLGMRNEIKTSNYLEAAGVIAVLRAGIDIKSMRRPLKRIGNLN